MELPKICIFFLGITLTWMGFIYTTKDLITSNIPKDELPAEPILCHNSKRKDQGDEYGTQDSKQIALAAIVPRAWEKYPGKTWRGLQLPVITAEPWGRLGNVMGEYASLYALGRTYNVTVRLSPDMKFYLRKIFPSLSMPLIPGKYLRFNWTPIGGVTHRNYANAEVAAAGLLGPNLFRIKDWPFEIQLFNAYRKEILQEFKFTPQVMSEVHQFLEEETRKANLDKTPKPVFVGIHIRRKDYLDFIQKTYNGHVPRKTYYERAMTYYRKKYPKVIFMVGSDDMLFVKKNFGGKPDVIFAPGSTREIDMAALASCNHSIISLGSYGFWTGYLAGGEVLYPNITFGLDYQFSREWYEIAKLDFFTPIAAD